MNPTQPFRPPWLLLIYFLLALLLTWPTVIQFTTHLPGDGGDDPAIAWNMWWIKYAVLNEGQNPFQTDFMAYPVGLNLAFYTLTMLNGLTALPLTLNVGTVAASNLHLWFTFSMGAYGSYLLTRYLLTSHHNSLRSNSPHVDSRIPAAMAGLFYAFASSKLFYVALGQFNIASNHWIPFAVLYIIRSHHQPSRFMPPFLAGLFFSLQAWAEMTYASFLLVFLALYWLWGMGSAIISRPLGKDNVVKLSVFWMTFLENRSLSLPKAVGVRQAQPAYSTNLMPLPWKGAIGLQIQAALILLITFSLGITPILAQMIPDMRTEGDFLVEGSGFAQQFSTDLYGFLIPTMHHPWAGHLITQSNIQNYAHGQHVYLGLTLFTLSLIGLIGGLTRRNRTSSLFWFFAATVFALLCLGPTLIINGQESEISGPFVLFQHLPFFRGNRYPSRYAVMLILCLSVTAAYGLQLIWQALGNTAASRRLSLSKPTAARPVCGNPALLRLPQQALRLMVCAAIAILFVGEHLSLPLPQSDMRLPAAYQTIAADPAEFSVLNIPFAWRNGFNITGAWTTQFMQSQFYQTAHQKRILHGNTSRNPAFKFQYFVNTPVINSLLALQTGKTLPPERWSLDPPLAAEVLRFFNIKYIVVGPDEPHAPRPVTPQATMPYIETLFPVEKIHADPDLTLYRVNQDSPPSDFMVQSTSPLAPLYLGEGWGALIADRPFVAQRNVVRLMLPLTPKRHHLTMRVKLPDFAEFEEASIWVSLNGWQSQPQAVTKSWQSLTVPIPAEIAHVGVNNVWLHTSDLTRLPDSTLTVVSAGEEVGGLGPIYLGGRDISPNQRGYNIAMIQDSGAITVANFDTHADLTASAALAEFLPAAPPQATIAVTVSDEASQTLTAEAVRALQHLGSQVDLRGCFRCSHAFIRFPDGRTVEQVDSLRPVKIGDGPTAPQVAVFVDFIAVE